MVSDTLDTGEIRRYGPKIFRRHGYLVGTAGASGLLQRILATSFPDVLSELGLATWIGQRVKEVNNVEEDGIKLLLCSPTEVWTINHDCVYLSPPGEPAAIGCGSGYALGYLDGRPGQLRKAVKSAIKRDPWCGGELQDVRIR